MKKALPVLLVLLAWAGELWAGGPPPNPSDYTVLVHVTFSRSGRDAGGAIQQQLQATIGDQQVELMLYAPGILQPGDYKARFIDLSNKHMALYDFAGMYEFLLPDGRTRSYLVTGLGPRDDSHGGSTPPVILRP